MENLFGLTLDLVVEVGKCPIFSGRGLDRHAYGLHSHFLQGLLGLLIFRCLGSHSFARRSATAVPAY